MSVELYVAKEFDTTYEREALSRFARSMGNRFGEKDDLHIILANYVIGGKKVDLTVLKKDAVIVIELKDCAEAFTAYDNKAWMTNRGQRIGFYEGMNPYQQVMGYRDEWVDLLRKHKNQFACLKNIRSNDKAFWYTKAFVVMFPYLHKDCANKISTKNWWFRLCGLNELDERISLETNKTINFSNDELRFIATELLGMDIPRVMQEAKTDKLAEQIRKGVDGLTGIVEDSKNRLAQLEQYLREKEDVIAGLQSSVDQLNEDLHKHEDMIEKIKLDKSKREEEIQMADAEKFHLISEYIVFNYYSGKTNKEEKDKLSKLSKLSGKFGIDRKGAAEIITKYLQQYHNGK